MKRFGMFLDRLNHNERPPEAQSPIGTAALAVLVSFVSIYWLDGQMVSSLRVWWEQLLVYGLIPMLFAFIILYRSAWHREIANAVRTPLLVLMSFIIFGGVLVSIVTGMMLLGLAYYAYGGLSRFHY